MKLLKKNVFQLIIMFLFTMNAIGQDSIIPLYKSEIPFQIKNDIKENKEFTDDGEIRRVRHINTPEIHVYKPLNNKSLTSAVIICPGGGYSYLSFNHEGVAVAKWFAERGITGVVLKSRLPDDRMMTNKEDVPLQDAKQAIRILRERSAEFNIDQDKIGIMGFSAGGHLAASLSTQFNECEKPDFSILIYPVISMDNGTHIGSRKTLLGVDADSTLMRKYSCEKNITSSTPPAFLVHAANDHVVPYKNSVLYYEALIANKVRNSEIHIFPNGDHGFGMAQDLPGNISKWTDLLENWLKNEGWLE